MQRSKSAETSPSDPLPPCSSLNTPRPQHPPSSVHPALNTPRPQHTPPSIHPVFNTPRPLYTPPSIHPVLNTPRPQYTPSSVHPALSTPRPQHTPPSIHPVLNDDVPERPAFLLRTLGQGLEDLDQPPIQRAEMGLQKHRGDLVFGQGGLHDGAERLGSGVETGQALQRGHADHAALQHGGQARGVVLLRLAEPAVDIGERGLVSWCFLSPG